MFNYLKVPKYLGRDDFAGTIDDNRAAIALDLMRGETGALIPSWRSLG